ncbi:MAG TPA: MarR family transcriptional regulator [Actinomycetes bacterium]|nr:MarR family transcriptional regulator [Actinomycetes bacterium]
MSSHAATGAVGAEDGRRPQEWPPAALADRLGFLLKHAQLELSGLSEPALRPLGIIGRELAVLSVLAGDGSLSQDQAARRLAIDRTTMVALLDGLQDKGLVERHPHPGDRRRNVVELTAEGRKVLDKAMGATRDAEARFLAPLGDADAKRFRDALRTLIASGARPR